MFKNHCSEKLFDCLPRYLLILNMVKVFKNYLGSLCWFSLGLQSTNISLEDLGIVFTKVNLGL